VKVKFVPKNTVKFTKTTNKIKNVKRRALEEQEFLIQGTYNGVLEDGSSSHRIEIDMDKILGNTRRRLDGEEGETEYEQETTEEEGATEFELQFEVTRTVWNQAMILDFDKNEDQGEIPQMSVDLENIVVPDGSDNQLYTGIWIIEMITISIVAYMLIKGKPLVWHIIDTVIVFCFMIYLQMDLPFNTEELFMFFNLKRFNFLPKVIESWMDPIDAVMEAPEAFHKQGKSSLYFVNMDLCLLGYMGYQVLYVLMMAIASTRRNSKTDKYEKDPKKTGFIRRQCINLYCSMQGDG